MGYMVDAGPASSYEPVPEGSYYAVCKSIVDIGRQDIKGDYPRIVNQVVVTWEIPSEKIVINDEEVPAQISQTYTASLNEKSNLRKDLVAWRGREFSETELAGFDLDAILGKGCMLQIVHSTKNNKKYANIASIMSLPKGASVDQPTELTSFVLSANSLDDIEKLPKWLQEKVKASLTYKEIIDSLEPFPDDGIHPFPDDEDLPF